MECWLATLNASSATMSHALQEANKVSRTRVICKSASIAPPLLLARLQGYSFQLAIQLVFPSYTLQLPPICVLPTDFKQSVRTSWEFSLEQVGISLTYEVTSLLGGRMKVPRLMSIGPMECWLATRNASSATMSHALQEAKKFLEQESSARVLQLLLISCLQGYSNQIFNLFSNLLFPHTLCSNPPSVSCRAFKTFCSSKRGLLEQVANDISTPCTHESNSLNVNTAKHVM